jgi:hypothetical protein
MNLSFGIGLSGVLDDSRLVQNAEAESRCFGGGHRRHDARNELSRRLYQAPRGNKLIASTFSASKVPDEKRGVTFAKFLGLAWTAANTKAKEIGWIV